MQYRSALFASASLVATSMAAYIPSEPWSTLTPSSPAPTGAISDHPADFGIAVVPIASSGKKVKRAVVSQIGDGQIQATTSTAAPKSTAEAISQIGDGQIQATTSTATAKSTAQAISQIGDGQIQATTSTAAPKSTAEAISQIGDGQIQATTSTAAPKSTAEAISQIGDGQIQATTSTAAAASTAEAISQIGDGQIQATTSTGDAVSQITDGQIQATSALDSTTSFTSTYSNSTLASTTLSTSIATSSSDDNTYAVACKNEGSLTMQLNDGILTDSAGRIGSIVANRQFQFDGPPPQAGAIYAAGWSITAEGNLAIGSNDIFYQCLSGTFYNLYDESIGDQCSEIYLEVVDLISC